jgi:hypothetical protein
MRIPWLTRDLRPAGFTLLKDAPAIRLHKVHGM